jgi:hypothetical protein
MAVCLFTFHAYGTWWPDNPRGYTKVEQGILPPDEQMAERYRQNAKFEPVSFDLTLQQVLIAGCHDICTRRDWRLHAVGSDPTHAHYLISQHGYFDFLTVRDKLKNLLSLFLGRATSTTGRKWFAHGGSNKRVGDRKHFDHLVETYLPSQRGLFWKEGMPLPEIPNGIL